MIGFIFAKVIHLLVLTGAVLITSKLLDGVKVDDFGSALRGSIVYSVLMFLFGWITWILLAPLALITFGLIVSAIFFWVTGKLVSGFEVRGRSAFLGALVLWGTNLALTAILEAIF